MALIDRAELFNRLSNRWDKAELYAALQAAPEVEAEPVRRAIWKRDDSGFYHCSTCNSETNYRPPYCFWCGSRMEAQHDNS